jgi:hypothetical protein
MRSTGTPLYGVTPAGGTQSRSIRRRYTTSATNQTNLNVDMVFGYNDSAFELNGIAEGNLRLFSAPALTGPFRPEFGTPSPMANVVTRNGLDNLSIWTLGNALAPLPVELTQFSAERQGADAQLRWNTASEKSNRGFEVQVSTDGREFRALAFVTGAGSSTTPRAYAYTDREAGKAGVRYYRLRQVDLDGTATLSPVRTVAFDEATATALSATPNPFGQELRLSLRARTANPAALLTLTDASGRTVLAEKLNVPAGASQPVLRGLEGLPTGFYLLSLPLDGKVQYLKVVKQ